MSVGVARARVWCFTPNPVFEIKFEPNRAHPVSSAGGKGHNVARQLRAWGVPAFSVVPMAGTEWMKAAQRDGSPIREIPIHSAARTGWAFLEQAGKRMDFFTEDPCWKRSDWSQCSKFICRLVRRGDWLVVAGSVPSGAQPGWWKSLFLGLKKRGVRILVDGKGQLLREALQAGVEWAKANLDEAEETMKRKGPDRCLAGMRTLSRGRCCLVITLGPRGLVMDAEKTKVAMPAPKVRLWDATGSGDVVTAALIYGIRRGWEIEKVAGFAVWAGSENAARRDGVVKRLKG
jgi:fructose-1-phosphate kinase PfkB-like protein